MNPSSMGGGSGPQQSSASSSIETIFGGSDNSTLYAVLAVTLVVVFGIVLAIKK